VGSGREVPRVCQVLQDPKGKQDRKERRELASKAPQDSLDRQDPKEKRVT